MPSPDELARMDALFNSFMNREYPEGSGNVKGAFYEEDMRNAFEAGYTERAHEK